MVRPPGGSPLMVKRQMVSVVRHHGPAVPLRTFEQLGVRYALQGAFGQRDGLDTSAPKLFRDGPWNHLIQQQPHAVTSCSRCHRCSASSASSRFQRMRSSTSAWKSA